MNVYDQWDNSPVEHGTLSSVGDLEVTENGFARRILVWYGDWKRHPLHSMH